MMKSIIIIAIIFLSTTILIAQDELSKPQPLDLTTISIKNPLAKKLFRSESIHVRDQNTTYLPEGEIQVLRVESPNRESCEEIINHLLVINDKNPTRIKKMNKVLAYQLKDASVWIHTTSGGYKYTKTANKVCQPTTIQDAGDAVEIGLTYIAENNLIKLEPNEELDIITVSKVHNSLTDIEKSDQPLEHFVSDYYVSFGHRYKDVPIIGSHITLRIDPLGNIAMISKNWRQIVKAEEFVKIKEEPLKDQIFNSPEFIDTYDGQEISSKDIHISYIRAGYIEAPFDFAQEQLRPGVLVSFWVGKERGESDMELLLPLEINIDPEMLLGVQSD